MKVLLINKFLYPKGGSETYLFKLGELLSERGHEVQYFGLENSKNIVGNNANSYVSDMDLNTGIRKNLTAPFRIIYSAEARKKIKKVLYDFKPDAIHLNNIQFYLTPSIILEIQKYRQKINKNAKIIYTAHDYQLICPSHGMFDSEINICEKCLDGRYIHCLKKKCMKNSRAKSFLAMLDAYYWKYSKAYSFIDTIICPSQFLKGKLDLQSRFADKTVAIHNFIEPKQTNEINKSDYVLEFGHLSRDKGTLTLLEVAKRMPNVRFVFAGYGAAETEIAKVPNAEFVGFKSGEELNTLISEALCTVCPSEMYENCPYSVMESQTLGTPVIGADIGGIPELISYEVTGLTFIPRNADDLEHKLRFLLETPNLIEAYTQNCKSVIFETPESYYHKIIKLYGE